MGNDNILNSDETFEKIATMTDDKQTNYMLQRMINDYLAKLKLPSTEEILKNADQTEEPGILTITHIKLLQCMVKDYYKASGGSIEISAKQKGIDLKEGTLSSLEEECIDKLLADYCKSVKAVLDSQN
ncbi:MAG: hypothetical protein IJO33_01070 [Bacilli bacterium]|nr:hypothetical protein [Bacilli bacterium]